jgi:site-specific recombinase XerD
MLLNNYCGCLLVGGKSEKTISQYRRTATKLAEFSGKTFLDIGVYDIRMFLGSERQRGVSNRTVENTRANLSAFFQWLLLEGHINKNPCMNIAPIKYADKVRLPFSSVEIDALRFACRTTKERAIVEVLISSGVRVSELTGLTVQDVNLGDLSVHVKNGKGGKERTVYINDLARTHLQAYLGERDLVESNLFLNKRREQLNAGGVRHILNEIGKRAGVDNVHPHRFRRTFATGMANRGMDIQEIRKLLGHSDINTTLQYVYTSDEKAHASYLRYSA